MDLRLTNSFPIAPKSQHPEVFDAVTEEKEGLLKELAARTIGNT